MNHTLWVASNVQKEIGPVAGVGLVVVGQAFVAGHFLGLAVSASVVINFAFIRGLEETKGVLANVIGIATGSRRHCRTTKIG